LLKEGAKASTVNAHLAAFGTFSAWLGYPRPCTDFLAYVLKGEGKVVGPLPKVRVHDIPWDAAIGAIDAAVVSLDTDPSHLNLSFLVLAILIMLWPVRPHTLVSVLSAASYL
jgi:hypothetical protein